MVPVASSIAGKVVGKKRVFVNEIAKRAGENCTISPRSGDENWLIVQADTDQAAENAAQAVERRIREAEATMEPESRLRRTQGASATGG